MKTTAQESTTQTKNEKNQPQQTQTVSTLVKTGRFPGRSVRPQGSMVKLKSFRPNRIVIGKSKS